MFIIHSVIALYRESGDYEVKSGHCVVSSSSTVSQTAQAFMGNLAFRVVKGERWSKDDMMDRRMGKMFELELVQFFFPSRAFAGLSARCRRIARLDGLTFQPRAAGCQGKGANDEYQFQQDRYFHLAIFIHFPKSTSASTRHGLRARRQALQNLYFLPQLEAPHWHWHNGCRQYDAHAREQEQQELWKRLCSASYRVFYRGCRSGASHHVRGERRRRTAMARGALSTRRRVTRSRNLDIPTHHRRILPRSPNTDSTSPHATAPTRPTSTLPMLTLRGRPRHAHTASPT